MTLLANKGIHEKWQQSDNDLFGFDQIFATIPSGRVIPPNDGYHLDQAQKKKYKLGFIIGRFQHIHIGHEKMIDAALSVCEKVILLVGSSQAAHELRNPFDVTMRKNLICQIYSGNPNLIVSDIKDLTHENDHSVEWGKYLLNRVGTIASEYGLGVPDLMIYGNDEERASWFDPEDIKNISQLIVNRGDINISATKMRNFLKEDNFWQWMQFSNPVIHPYFSQLKKKLDEVGSNK